MFSCEFSEIFKNTFSYRTSLVATSDMSDSVYSEHESENSFDENEDNEIDNLYELFKEMGLEPYQFEPTKKNYEKSQEGSSQTQKKNIFLINH